MQDAMYEEARQDLSFQQFDIYQLINFSPDYPFFFTIHSIWICICLRQYHTKLDWHKSILIHLVMNLMGKFLAAYLCGRIHHYLTHQCM